MSKKRLVIKVGTNVLQRENGKLDYNLISALSEQVADLRQQGYEVLLVSSGSVGAGREMSSFAEVKKTMLREQMMAAVGQVRLMQIYWDFFVEQKITIAQVLVTYSDFQNKKSYLNILNTLEGLLQAEVLPILNENDVVSTEEMDLQLGDNDQLAVYIASLIQADALFFLTTSPGLLKDPHSPATAPNNLITRVETFSEDLYQYCATIRSSGGRGGMESKVRAAGQGMQSGMEVYILDGKVPNGVKRIMEGEPLGTHFTQCGKKIRSYSSWLKHFS